jgi:SWI/SNF-related matrix-associated actin-dependent regulator of chromatin subfamily A3
MQTRAQIEAAIQMRETFGTMANYTNMLQRIEAMRMVCNLGLYYHSRKRILDSYQSQIDVHDVSWDQVAQRTFDMRREMDAMHCRICTYPIDAIDMNTELLGTGQPLFFRCWEFVCSLCSSSVPRSWECSSHTPSCPVAVATTEVAGLGEINSNTSSFSCDTAISMTLPTKVSLLIQDLQAQADTKW